MFRYLGFAILVGESPTLTIVRSGQVVISGIGGGNNFYESPEVNGQSAEQKAQVGTIPWSNKMESLSIKQRLPSRNYPLREIVCRKMIGVNPCTPWGRL